MSKFKIGDRVQLNKSVKCFKYGQGLVSYGEIGVIKTIEASKESYEYTVIFPIDIYWDGTEDELVLYKETVTFSKEDLKPRLFG